MKSFLYLAEELIYSNFASCFVCKTRSIQDGPFCIDCFNRWDLDRKAKGNFNENGLKVFPIWVWNQGDFSMYDLIQKQKNGFKPIASWLAQLMLSRNRKQLLSNNVSFVPVPTKNKKSKDHAHQLAAYLASLSGHNFSPVLQNKSQQNAKNHSKIDRKNKIRIGSIEKISKPGQVILVDDVLTTGTTAYACYKALDTPQNFEVWTIAYRRLDDS